MNPKQIEEFFHLTPVQKQLLQQSELSADTNSYLAQFGCYLTGNLDVSAFERAWQKVTNRQPGLRMTFVSGDLKEPVQVVNRNVNVDLEKQDWRNLDAVDQERRLHELLQSDRQCSLVLKTPPLWRMTLIRLAEDQYYFVWTYHELLFDEHSLPLIFNEALASYAAIQQGKNETLPLPISFRKYVEWVKKQDVQKAESFWRAYLKGIYVPTALELTAEPTVAQLDFMALDRLKLLAADAKLSLDIIVQGAWALLLSRLSGQADVLFGSTVAGRPQELHAVDRSIGHFSNVLPLRVRVSFEMTVLEYLAKLQDQQRTWQQYEHNSLTQIQRWSEIHEELPLFQSVLIFDSAELETSLHKSIAGLEISPERLVLPNDFPLTVMVKENENGWQITSNDACASQLQFFLEQFAQNPERRLAALQLPAHAAAENPPVPPLDLPADWTEPVEDEQGWVAWLKAGDCVHELFEQRAARMPDAIAVRFENGALTYQELNARANQLARYLHKLKVLPSIPVGLCFTPCLEAVIGLLGVLKAGGAYLPIESQLAPSELQGILEESAVAIVLTEARLEPKFRTIPAAHMVLCLDSDWPIIAEEESENPAFQVSDEHPACFLATTPAPTLIPHASLAQALAGMPEWFRFDADNPWHLWGRGSASAPIEVRNEVLALDMTPAPAPTPIEDNVPFPELELDPLPELNSEPNWELVVDTEVQATPENAASTLAPIQQWFFEQHPLDPQHWNISLLVEISNQLDRVVLEQALQAVVAQHEALRWRYVKTATGWQVNETPSETISADALPFEYVDFSAKWARSQRKAIEEMADSLQTSLHLTDGPLWRVAYFDLGASRAHRLLVIFHHLIGDEASLRIFLEDLLEAYWQLRQNRAIAPPPKRTSYAEWLQVTQAGLRRTALDYWQRIKTVSFGALPVDYPDGVNTYGQMDRVFVSLNSAETESLLQQVPQAANAELNELVLTALALALANWTNNRNVLVEIERDARRQPFADLAVTRTLGWFTAKFPVWLEVEKNADVLTTLRAVQAQLRAVPDNGLSYGWLRYGNDPKAKAALRELPQPQIAFKYLDLVAQKLDWHLASETVGLEYCPDNERSTLLAVTGAMNLNMLEFQLKYARAQFEQRTIGVLVNHFITELRRLIQLFSAQRASVGE